MRLGQLVEEIHARQHAHVADVGARDHRPIDVNRVAGIGHQDDVAGVQGGERQMRDPFLRADRDDRLPVGIQLDREAPLVPVADRLAQPQDALGHRVAMGIAALCRLDQLVHDVAWRGLVRIAHAEVDDVLAPLASGRLQLGGDVEDVGRQALDARELLHESINP